jgi:uncharacterized protein (TIGR02246 family)
MTDHTSPSVAGSQPNDEQAIHQLSADWMAAVKAKDISKLLSLVTDDVVFLPPGLPPLRGKPAVEAMYKSFFPQFSSIEQHAALEEVEVAGDWAFAWGSETFVLIPQPGGSPIQMDGKGLSILKRQPDGSWKFSRAVNNTQPRTVPGQDG